MLKSNEDQAPRSWFELGWSMLLVGENTAAERVEAREIELVKVSDDVFLEFQYWDMHL